MRYDNLNVWYGLIPLVLLTFHFPWLHGYRYDDDGNVLLIVYRERFTLDTAAVVLTTFVVL